ncbi:MAG: spondin domain-containing protein [Granulosicoccus sp.]|nr:spondin domain-containing protein [Granulosicoccus sp.]
MTHNSLYRILLSTVLLIFLAACSSDSTNNVDETTDPVEQNPDEQNPDEQNPDEQNPDEQIIPEMPPELAQNARYRLTFTATWSVETHPDNFPPNPHFSGLIGGVHNEQVIFWESGQIASDGLEAVAETGAKTSFRNEVNAAIDDGRALALIDAGGVALSPGTVSTEFSVNRDYPEITVISMLAPSPDWFVGVRNLSLLNDSAEFVQMQTIDLNLYDSGTDSGISYTSGNSDTNPRDPVALFTSADSSLPFVDGMPVVGQFLIEKIE